MNPRRNFLKTCLAGLAGVPFMGSLFAGEAVGKTGKLPGPILSMDLPSWRILSFEDRRIVDSAGKEIGGFATFRKDGEIYRAFKYSGTPEELDEISGRMQKIWQELVIKIGELSSL